MRAAFYECDITPPLGGFMWGHYKDVRAYKVKDRLYAKAAVVENGGRYAAIVAVDTCSLTPGIHRAIAERVAEYTPIPAQSVCVSSDHTHSGAPISDDPSCGGKADAAYLDVFLRLCADAIILAYHRLEDTRASFSVSQVKDISFNRNFITDRGVYVTHGKKRKDVVAPLDGIDPDLPVLFFEGESGPLGAIINFACHQCCLTQYSTVGYSGDYSSYLSKHLKKVYGQDFVSLFLLAPCGDINHVNPDPDVVFPPDWYQHMVKVLADAVIASREYAEPVEGEVQALMAHETVPRRPADDDTVRSILNHWVENGVSFMRIRNLIHYHANGGKVASDLLPVQALVIGDVLISVLPGEIYHSFGKYIKKNSPFTKNMVVENCNEYCGYVPSEKAFAENNDLYETSLCHHSCLEVQAGNKIVDQLLQMSKKI